MVWSTHRYSMLCMLLLLSPFSMTTQHAAALKRDTMSLRRLLDACPTLDVSINKAGFGSSNTFNVVATAPANTSLPSGSVFYFSLPSNTNGSAFQVISANGVQYQSVTASVYQIRTVVGQKPGDIVFTVTVTGPSIPDTIPVACTQDGLSGSPPTPTTAPPPPTTNATAPPPPQPVAQAPPPPVIPVAQTGGGSSGSQPKATAFNSSAALVVGANGGGSPTADPNAAQSRLGSGSAGGSVLTSTSAAAPQSTAIAFACTCMLAAVLALCML